MEKPKVPVLVGGEGIEPVLMGEAFLYVQCTMYFQGIVVQWRALLGVLVGGAL